MKKYLTIIAAVAAVLTTAACKKAAEIDYANDNSIALQPETITAKADGETVSATFSAADYWFASCPEKWVVIDDYSGKPGDATLSIKVEKNTTTSQRSAVVTVNVKGRKGHMTITQEAGKEEVPPEPGPDYSGKWTIYGCLDNSEWKDFDMTDKGNLVWEATIPFRPNDCFKFRMDGSDDVTLGLSGDMTAAEGVQKGTLVEDGSLITLPGEALWVVTLDLNELTVTATFVEDMPPVNTDPKPLPENWVAVWQNDGSHGEVGWDSIYRFALEGTDANSEALYEFPADVWNKLKTSTFYLYLQATDPQVRITNGWWDPNWNVGDIQPGNERLADNGGDTWIVTINLTEDAAFVASLDERHLLFTGARFTPLGIYVTSSPLDGAEMIWQNDGSHGQAGWDGTYRFCLEGTDANGECIHEFPAETWEGIKTQKVLLLVQGDNPQIRVTNGWWDVNFAPDFQPGNKSLTDNGDGTWILSVTLADSPELIASLEEKHLLFTGAGFTPLAMYLGPADPAPVVFWENGDGTPVSWNGVYRFCLEGTDPNKEALVEFPQDLWNKILSQTFYLDLEASSPNIRVVNAWWDAQWHADFKPGSELLTENGDGTWTLEVNLSDSPDFVATLEEKHLLFTGDAYTPLRLYFVE